MDVKSFLGRIPFKVQYHLISFSEKIQLLHEHVGRNQNQKQRFHTVTPWSFQSSDWLRTFRSVSSVLTFFIVLRPTIVPPLSAKILNSTSWTGCLWNFFPIANKTIVAIFFVVVANLEFRIGHHLFQFLLDAIFFDCKQFQTSFQLWI